MKVQDFLKSRDVVITGVEIDHISLADDPSSILGYITSKDYAFSVMGKYKNVDFKMVFEHPENPFPELFKRILDFATKFGSNKTSVTLGIGGESITAKIVVTDSMGNGILEADIIHNPVTVPKWEVKPVNMTVWKEDDFKLISYFIEEFSDVIHPKARVQYEAIKPLMKKVKGEKSSEGVL